MRFTNCLVPQEGHRNHDNYVRVLDKPRNLGGRLVMLHRLEWEKVNGPIPEGYEINHRCKNRECCNINHLEVLSKSEHKSEGNSLRYKSREDLIVARYMLNPHLTQYNLAENFGVSQPSISSILKRRITNVPS